MRGTPESTAQTPSVMGISTPSRCASSRSTGAVVSPSTTIPIERAASSGVAPCATSSPQRLFRPERAQQVTTRSPIPARPAKVSGPGAGHLGQPPHLGEAAGDERRLRVVAEPEPVGPSRRERDHVLRRRAELDAEDVVVHVDTEGRRRDRELELHGEREALARDHRGGGQALRDLLRDVRAGEDRDRAVANDGRETVA